MEQITFTAKGSKGKHYKITAKKDQDSPLAIQCNCSAGAFGGFCKHRLALIYGNLSEIVKDKNLDEDFVTFKEWLKGSAIADAASKFEAVSEAIEELEISLNDTKAYLKKALLGKISDPKSNSQQARPVKPNTTNATFTEEAHLEKLWRLVTDSETGNKYYQAKKSTRLIVPRVDYDPKTMNGSLNSDDWAFIVPYAFRDALGISFDQRFKNKKPYMVWVQSPYIDFKEGDSLQSKSGEYSLSVKMATPMSRDKFTHAIDYGLVDFQILKRDGSKMRYHAMKTMTQYEFLQTLIYGLPESML